MNRPNRNAKPLLVVVVVVSIVMFLAAGGLLLTTATTPPATPTINFVPPVSLDELAAQYPAIAGILRDPALGSAYKEFMVAYQQGGLPAAQALAQERGLLNKQNELQLTLVLDSSASAPAVSAELQAMGVIIVGSYDEFIDIAIPLALIDQVAKAGNPGQVFAQLTTLNHVLKVRLPEKGRPGAIGMLSEAVSTTGAEEWHKQGFTGKGIKIGVLDGGFDGYKALLGKKLPARVTAKSFVPGVEPDATGEDHGTMCAQIVYAMAPGADLYLAFFDTVVQQSAAIDWLVSQGVTIISHSIGYDVMPLDGTSVEAKLVDRVAAKGVLWVNSAGNHAQAHLRITADAKSANQWVDLPNGAPTIKVAPHALGERMDITLQWNDWTGNATQDYDLFLYDAKGNLIGSSKDTQAGHTADSPVEWLAITARQPIYFIKILAAHTTHPATLDLFVYPANLENYTPGYSVVAPADARSALAVGAIFWKNNALEPYSSRGPTYDGRIKPDIVAPDGVTVAEGMFRGTSAAAPHVAGAAALVWQRFPTLSSADVKAYLMAQSIDMGARGADNDYGSGRLQLPSGAVAAPTQIAVAPTIAPSPTITAIALASPTVRPSPLPTSVPPTKIAEVPVPTSVPPTALPVPKPPASNATTGTIVLLSLLMCGGLLGSVGGMTMLILISRPTQPQPTPAPASPSPRPYTPQPSPAIHPATGVLWLVGANRRVGPLPIGPSSIGRTQQNTFQIDLPEISRQHATLTWDGARCTLSDNHSSNGTYVNGRRLAPSVPQMLQPGDQVSFGGVVVWTVVRQ